MNNCGGQQALCDKFSQLSGAQIRKSFEVNVFSTFFLTKAALAVMSEDGCVLWKAGDRL